MSVCKLFCLVSILLSMAGTAPAATVAVTEFLADANGSDSNREWVELFNYGTQPVNLSGWVLGDQDSNAATLPAVSIPSGGYLVVTTSPAQFQADWLGGAADPRVIAPIGGGFVLSNTSDEIVLKDGGGSVQWSLAYGSTPGSGMAAALPDGHDFHYSSFGSKGAPGVVYGGLDANGTTGYEAIADLLAAQGLSAPESIEGDLGTPLTGGYAVLSTPLPSSAWMLGLGLLFLLSRRRRWDTSALPRCRRAYVPG